MLWVVRWHSYWRRGPTIMGPRLGENGAPYARFLWWKGRQKKNFILYKRAYYVFQVAFVVSIYKIRYTRGLGTIGRVLPLWGFATPAEMSCFCKRATTELYEALIKPVSRAFSEDIWEGGKMSVVSVSAEERLGRNWQGVETCVSFPLEARVSKSNMIVYYFFTTEKKNCPRKNNGFSFFKRKTRVWASKCCAGLCKWSARAADLRRRSEYEVLSRRNCAPKQDKCLWAN